MNKTNGFNLKYRYEQDNNPLGVIGSFTYTEKDRTENGAYNKGQYYGITAGPAYRLNDWASIYGVVGVGYGKFQQTENQGLNRTASTSDYGFSYGAGLQFNPIGTLLWTSPMSRAVSATLTLAPDRGRRLPLLITPVIE